MPFNPTRKALFYLYFIIFCSAGNILNAQDFSQLDSLVRSYPGKFKTPADLAYRIRQDFQSPEERSRAIYSWITHNIRYDVKIFTDKYKKKEIREKQKQVGRSRSGKKKKAMSPEKRFEKLVLKTFYKRKAVCAGYSALFEHLHLLCKIPCKTISGHAKTEKKHIGHPWGARHAWNAVYLDSAWHLVDATWGAGYVEKEKQRFTKNFSDFYFRTPPELFFSRHFPRDTSWLLTNKTRENFKDLPLYSSFGLKNDIRIQIPAEGMLCLRKNEETFFQLRSGIGAGNIYCTFSNKKKKVYHLEYTKSDDDIYTFRIRNLIPYTGYVSIYVDGYRIATYKIQTEPD